MIQELGWEGRGLAEAGTGLGDYKVGMLYILELACTAGQTLDHGKRRKGGNNIEVSFWFATAAFTPSIINDPRSAHPFWSAPCVHHNL